MSIVNKNSKCLTLWKVSMTFGKPSDEIRSDGTVKLTTKLPKLQFPLKDHTLNPKP